VRGRELVEKRSILLLRERGVIALAEFGYHSVDGRSRAAASRFRSGMFPRA
jgi:hypothetical protein